MIRFFLCICKSVMENHYNLLYREDERELIPICKQMNVSLMPYSPLAAGHLARTTWKSESLRGRTDRVAVIGATKRQYLDDSAGALNVRLTAEGIAYLEECYVPHPIVGAIDKNPAQGVMLLDEKK